MKPPKYIVMVASENDALRGGKVGGLGDVLRDLPRALVKLGWDVDVITPSYGFLHKENPSTHYSTVKFPFEGKRAEGEVWRVIGKEPGDGVQQFVVEHPLLRGDRIYYNDPPETPFMRDAHKYALFCSAVGQFVGRLQVPFVLHLHDWHAATLLLLQKLHPEFARLKDVRTAFTIHNVAIQGTRPMHGDSSSLESWFPELFRLTDWIESWHDPRSSEPSYNPMAVGIRRADKVNTVSPGYAREILKPSDPKNGHYGGEGMESMLLERQQQGQLVGILNGCEYTDHRSTKRLSYRELCDLICSEVSGAHDPVHDELLQRLGRMRDLDPSFILASVARIVEQKVRLFFEAGRDGATAIEGIMKILADHNGVCIIVGSGAAEYEMKLREAFRRSERLIFVNGYFEKISQALYASSTLFLMPSSFEPCGISQMIAMREGQPCIVHAVGGLRDTVLDEVNGFTFDGGTMAEQVDEFVRVVEKAVTVFLERKSKWEKIKFAAESARFTWASSALQYIEKMYV